MRWYLPGGAVLAGSEREGDVPRVVVRPGIAVEVRMKPREPTVPKPPQISPPPVKGELTGGATGTTVPVLPGKIPITPVGPLLDPSLVTPPALPPEKTGKTISTGKQNDTNGKDDHGGKGLSSKHWVQILVAVLAFLTALLTVLGGLLGR